MTPHRSNLARPTAQDLAQIARFAAVGATATLGYLAVSFLLLKLSVVPQIANGLALGASLLFSYAGHYFFTFQSSDSHLRTGPRFGTATIALLLVASALHQLVLLQGMSAEAAAIAVAIIYPPLSFLISHFWTFAHSARHADGELPTPPSAFVRAKRSLPRPSWPITSAAALVLAMAAMATFSPDYLVYDERYYMQIAFLLKHGAGFFEMMGTRTDIAAGPLYAYLHYAASPLTGLVPPGIRFVNLILLVVGIVLVARTIRILGHDNATASAAMLLAVPMVAPMSGLALTEIPAFVLMSLAVALFAAGLVGRRRPAAFALFALSGLFAGLAVLGRQTYLPVLAGPILVAVSDRRYALHCAATVAAALLAIAPMLIAWRGLAPPWMADDVGGFVPLHGVLAFVYLALVIVLIAPAYLVEPFATVRSRLAGAAAIAVLLVLSWLLGLRFDVAGKVIGAFPLMLRPLLEAMLASAMLSLAGLSLYATGWHVWHRRHDRQFLLFGVLVVLLNGTAAGIAHQFSSRYVMTAFPFVLLLLLPWIHVGRLAAARVLVGGSLGLASLAGYYWNDGPAPPDQKWFGPPEILADMPLREFRRPAE